MSSSIATATAATHTPTARTVQVDLLVIGGGPAGLSAANFFSRTRRSCLIYDSGLYRNAPSAVAHTIVGFEGVSPATFRETVRKQVEDSYDPLTKYKQGKIVNLKFMDVDKTFEARDEEGNMVKARKVVLATGLKDHLPAIPGLAQQWGRRVVHCIFCHGTETAQKPFAYLFTPNNAMMNPMLVGSMLKMWPTLEHDPKYILTHGMDVDTVQGREKAGMNDYLDVIQRMGYIVITSPIASVVEDVKHSCLVITFTSDSQPSIRVPSMLVFPERCSPSEHSSPLLTENLLRAPLSQFGTIAPPVISDAVLALPPRMGDDPRTNVPGLFWAGKAGSVAANVTVSIAQGQTAAALAIDELGTEDLRKS